MRLYSLLSFFLFASCLSAQYQFVTVDVLPDKKQFTYIGTKSVYQMEPDGLIKELSNLLPENAETLTVPRHRVRFDRVWYSDGKEIFNRPLNAANDDKWESVKLPGGISKITDFEIISETEMIICGAWFINGISDIHFLFDYTTGKITKTFKSRDGSFDKEAKKAIDQNDKQMSRANFYKLLKMTDSYSCMFDPYVLIVEKTGNVIIYDTKTREARTVEIIPSKELPEEPEKLLRTFPTPISWVSPLSGGEVLMACRMDAAKADKPDEYVTMRVFRKLDLKSGKVTLHGTEYQGERDADKGPFIEVEGRLMRTMTFLEKRGFARVSAK